MTEPRFSALVLPGRREIQEITRAWEAFMAGRDTGLEKVRPAIRESWLRAQRSGMDPYLREAPVVLAAEELERVQERRERKEDISLLARHLLAQLGFPHLRLSAEAVTLLGRYEWPGNVRELKNLLLRAAHAVTGATITPAELPPELAAAARKNAAVPAGALKETEVTLIRLAIAEAGGNLARAATRLGIHRVTLYRKLKRYGLSQAGALYGVPG